MSETTVPLPTETKACQHCYARIIQVDGGVWVDVDYVEYLAQYPLELGPKRSIHCAGEPKITHTPMPDILKEEHAN
jgi:hypothetical protein